MAARPEPMAKVMEMVLLTLMPMSWAAPLSSLTARMALPILVLLVNSVRPIIMTTQTTMVSRAVLVMVAEPMVKDLEPSILGKLLGLEDQISRAAFCRK